MYLTHNKIMSASTVCAYTIYTEKDLIKSTVLKIRYRFDTLFTHSHLMYQELI